MALYDLVEQCPLIGLIQYDNGDHDNNKIAQSNLSTGRRCVKLRRG